MTCLEDLGSVPLRGLPPAGVLIIGSGKRLYDKSKKLGKSEKA
jgi:hypothetical protein